MSVAFAPLTLGISFAWSLATAFHRLLFLWGIKHSIRLPVRVLSVGNFEAGGTGKTPFVAWLARDAARRGHRPVILTRGYGGAWERTGGLIRPGEDFSAAELSGDEPALLHDLCPEAWIGIGADRLASYERVVGAAHASGAPAPDLVILDDGLQHLRLARDLDLVLGTSARPWQKLFREFPFLHRGPAVLFLWTKGPRPPWSWEHFDSRVGVRWIVRSPSEPERGLDLWLVTGVADGGKVRESLERAGWRIGAHTSRRDHVEYSRETLERQYREAEASGLRLATTGKDWVKWRQHGIRPDSVLVFEPEIVWDEEGRSRCSRMLWENHS